MLKYVFISRDTNHKVLLAIRHILMLQATEYCILSTIWAIYFKIIFLLNIRGYDRLYL